MTLFPTWPPLKSSNGPQFDGCTYSKERDHARLTGLLSRVYELMAREDRWWSLAQINAECGGTESSVSARLRDLRKEKFGGHTIEHRCVSKGFWQYRMPK